MREMENLECDRYGTSPLDGLRRYWRGIFGGAVLWLSASGNSAGMCTAPWRKAKLVELMCGWGMHDVRRLTVNRVLGA